MPRRQGNPDSAGQTEALPETTPPSDCGFLGVENLRIAYDYFKDGIERNKRRGRPFLPIVASLGSLQPPFSRRVYIPILPPYKEAFVKGVDRKVNRTSGMHLSLIHI